MRLQIEFLQLFDVGYEWKRSLAFIYAEWLGWIMRCITWHDGSTYSESQENPMYTGCLATSMSHENLSFSTRYWKRNSINYKLLRNIFLYHRPILSAASAGGLSIAFLTEAANTSTVFTLRCTQTPHMYSQGYHLRKSKNPFCKYSSSSLNFPIG